MGAVSSNIKAVLSNVDPLIGTKTREDKLAVVFNYVDKKKDGVIDMSELTLMAEKLDKRGLEEVRQEFIKLDQDQDGVITLDEFTDYYMEQLGAYEDQEFTFWCHAILHLKHYGLSKLYKHGMINEKGEDAYRAKKANKKKKEEEDAKKLAAEMNIDPVAFRKAKSRKMELKRIKMIVEGTGSLCDYSDGEVQGTRKKIKKLKAAAKVIGHFGAHLSDERASAKLSQGF